MCVARINKWYSDPQEKNRNDNSRVIKKLIQLWQTSEWDAFENLLSEDVELEKLGIDPVLGREDVFEIVK